MGIEKDIVTVEIFDTENVFFFLLIPLKTVLRKIYIPSLAIILHMFYSIACQCPFRCPKVLFGPFRWHKSFSVFSRTPFRI